MPGPPDPAQGPRRRLSSLLLPPPAKPSDPKKKPSSSFPSMPFRGLGCSSSSAARALPPCSSSSAAAAAVRSSADWPPRKPRRKKKHKRKDAAGKERLLQTNCVVNPSDVWCAVDSSVDCVPPHFHRSSAPPPRVERPPREDALAGRMGGGEDRLRLSVLLDDPQSPEEVGLFGNDEGMLRRVHRMRRIRRSPGGLDELMIFQARILLGEMDIHDRYRDLRLDVDNMSYEELLELGDRIGHVNTGLREEEIVRCLRKMKHTIFSASALQLSSELERKCSICQEDYEVNEEVGKLDCGHGYHPCCIKQWLLRKNACPVCKATVGKG